MSLRDRAKEAWNAFIKVGSIQDEMSYGTPTYGGPSPSRSIATRFNERTILASILTRLSIDVADVIIQHIKRDPEGRYNGVVTSALNMCLTLDPNMDQGPRAFRQDIAMTMFEDGVAAIVPVDTVANPELNDTYQIFNIRVGRIVAWFPHHVRVSCYNELNGRREEITLQKDIVAIVENPLYEVMNTPNSTLQRLIQKLRNLDDIDDAAASGKIDVIIQLPYTIKSEARRQQAQQRTQDIEFQLKGSAYGIAYADATEKITQLNRPVENNMIKHIEVLLDMLYSQLGLTPAVMNGTADESEMNNYYHRSIKPIVESIVEAMTVAFVSPVGLAKGERIQYHRDPFKFVPMDKLADIADKFSRNEIATPNEIRGAIGMPPHPDPKADELQNSNMPSPEPTEQEQSPPA